ncbi:hypothetical protein BBO99_00008622 [Phytophthora kernoviae]|uniref:Bromo domain-containing protein n=2 Tax=Phytophthora kernoviae TaxID=325452 RepID=A0A3R7GRN3_9STRA|nr:hypothetical protein G195_010326 [Phytophthora kernoviae 00238/432]KAG2514656.1 hypothetical protein JM16_007814 [Phytophthora kernoviae]KAG2519226.1 hypothetical protein JM18_007624 [Phytophthora kernoviae]RLN31948.1 hypothetical protein BBI17_008629 [Phytophthora kernoviae]RLN74985.1 hypothetical protein BBO99_00008622 [Phytophthora kernoviae]
MLGPEELQEDAIDANGTGSNGDLEEELVVCAKCDRCFHATCCDPPHAPISLMNPENGEVLVSDLKIPFVCSDCASNRDEGIAKPAKMAEEEFAHSLQFSTTYDPKVLHNYECLTCRKVRMLHVLHRLGREDKLDLFKEPVTEAIAPTYFDVIKSPMDLSTMRHNILDGNDIQLKGT